MVILILNIVRGGSVKPLELIFKDMTFIRALALDNIRKSVVPKQAIMSYMRRFLADIKDNPEFLSFFLKEGILISIFAML